MMTPEKPPSAHRWVINTSNQGKQAEFKRLFAEYGLTLDVTAVDLPEIKADPVSVVVHKASQVPAGVIVEDTSLEIAGVEVGVNVRWFSKENLAEYVGRPVVWRVLLAYAQDGMVHVFEGKVHGTVVDPRGDQGFGFDPIFLPVGAHRTLAEEKPNTVNARALVVAAFAKNRPHAIVPVTTDWDGPWQDGSH